MTKDDLGKHRPDCQICKKPKSAVMFINNKMMCPQCVYKYDAFVKEQEAKRMDEFINANTKT